MTTPIHAATLAYASVLTAELLGDKTIFTLGVLVSRHRISPVFFGAIAAFMLKFAVAVAVAQLGGRIPVRLLSYISAAAFFGMAVVWIVRAPRFTRNPPDGVACISDVAARGTWFSAAAATLGTLFLSEWGDPGQLAVIGLAATYNASLAVWVGSVLAMTTKAGLVVLLGARLRRYVPVRALRGTSIALYLCLGASALWSALSS